MKSYRKRSIKNASGASLSHAIRSIMPYKNLRKVLNLTLEPYTYEIFNCVTFGIRKVATTV